MNDAALRAPAVAEPGRAVTDEDAASFKEVKQRQPLYASRIKIYPKGVAGFWRRFKWAWLIALLAIYYVTPWLRWDRGPDAPNQAVLIDMPARRAYVFWLEIWPQEVYYLTGLLILGALGLFFVTALFGRFWCGFTCPQTVWTDLFMWVERNIEGDRAARIRLDKQPWSGAKAGKKVAKHGAWLLIALLTGGAWIMYFNDAPTVTRELFTGEAGAAVYFFVGLFTATTYLLAGWAREQVCTYMCPWPRFQAAMLDEDSFVVTYRDWRGEPRGKYRKRQGWEGRGDCIDCNNCVAVCPMGIDIRDGLQLECIGCGLCVDACDDVMDKVGRPRGLIAFDTERSQHLRRLGKPPAYRFVRPRTLIYAVVLLLLGVLMLGSLAWRASSDITVLHERNPLFVTLSNGDVRNGYTIKILNKAREPRAYTLALADAPRATLRVVGRDEDVASTVLPARADGVSSYRVHVRLPRQALDGEGRALTFVLTEVETGETAMRETVFRGPA